MGDQNVYFAAVDFDALLAGLRQNLSQQNWESQALAELRLDKIDSKFLELHPNLHVAPYADSLRYESNPPAEGIHEFVHWSDLRNTQVDAALILEQLQGGVEAIWLSQAQIQALVGKTQDIRFDFIALGITARDATGLGALLRELIPEDQRAESRIQLHADPEMIPSLSPELKSWPGKVYWLFESAREGLSSDQPVELLQSLLQSLASILDSLLAEGILGLDQIVVKLPSGKDYLRNILLLHALRMGFERLLARRGLSASSQLRILSFIDARDAASAEHHLIDASTRAIAVLSASTNALVIQPFADSRLELRRTRNLQNVLKIEAGLGAQGDALRGAYFFENAAGDLLDFVWTGLE